MEIALTETATIVGIVADWLERSAYYAESMDSSFLLDGYCVA